jgi:hypothetical protein
MYRALSQYVLSYTFRFEEANCGRNYIQRILVGVILLLKSPEDGFLEPKHVADYIL